VSSCSLLTFIVRRCSASMQTVFLGQARPAGSLSTKRKRALAPVLESVQETPDFRACSVSFSEGVDRLLASWPAAIKLIANAYSAPARSVKHSRASERMSIWNGMSSCPQWTSGRELQREGEPCGGRMPLANERRPFRSR
jgi:hypothetical protein